MELLTRVEPERIRALLERDEFFWVDLMAAPEEEIDRLASLLQLPHFAVEDSKEFGQRPKVDEYGERVLIVFYGAGEDDELVEVHIHLSGSWIVTLRRASCAELEAPRRAVREGGVRSELDLVFKILDALADSLVGMLDRLNRTVEDLQERAFEHPDDTIRREIAALRGRLFRLQQIARPQRDMLGAEGDLLERLPGLEGEASRHPFREVHDVLVQASNRIDYLRELLTGALGIYLSSTSNRLNALATRLAILGTIFLPLTFITGFFGQNFGWLVGHIRGREAFLVWTIGPTLVVLAVAVALGLLSSRRR